MSDFVTKRTLYRQEMLLHNWIISPIEPPRTSVAKRQVWEAVLDAARPTLFEQLLQKLSWFFALPIRTAAFSLALFVVVLGGGYYVPTKLKTNQLHQEADQLQSDLQLIETDLNTPLSLE